MNEEAIMNKKIESFEIMDGSDEVILLTVPIQLKRENEVKVSYDCFVFRYGSLHISFDQTGKFLRHFNSGDYDDDTIHLIKYKYHSVDKFTYLFSIKSSGIFQSSDNAYIYFGGTCFEINKNNGKEEE